jgi:hypothetical protein
MSKWQIAGLIALLALVVVAAFGQDKPKVELKPEVKLTLVSDQNDMYKLALQMKQLETQYQQGQAAMAKLQAKLAEDTKSALAKSGIDTAKYEINVETFDVTPKVVVKDAPHALDTPASQVSSQ